MAVTNAVDLEVLLGWVPQAEGFQLTILYNAPGDRDDDRYFGQHPVRLDLDRLDDVSDETDAVSVVTGAFPVVEMDGIDGAGLQRATRMSVHELPRLIFEWQRDVDTSAAVIAKFQQRRFEGVKRRQHPRVFDSLTCLKRERSVDARR